MADAEGITENIIAGFAFLSLHGKETWGIGTVFLFKDYAVLVWPACSFGWVVVCGLM